MDTFQDKLGGLEISNKYSAIKVIASSKQEGNTLQL